MILKLLKRNGIEILVFTVVVVLGMALSLFIGASTKYVTFPINGTPLFNDLYDTVFHGHVSVGTQTMSLLLAAVEIFLVVVMNSRFELTRAKGTVFILFYNLLALSYIPFNTLLPEQIANVFIIWGFIKVFSSHGKDDATYNFYDAGLLFGLASLFCLPAAIMLIIGIIALVIYRPMKLNEYVIYILGFLTSWIFYVAIYYIVEGTVQPLLDYFASKVAMPLQYHVNQNGIIAMGASVLLIMVFSVLILQEYPKYNLFESRAYRLFFIMFLMMVVISLIPAVNIQCLRLLVMPVTMLYVTVLYSLKENKFADILLVVTLLIYLGMQALWYRM